MQWIRGRKTNNGQLLLQEVSGFAVRCNLVFSVHNGVGCVHEDVLRPYSNTKPDVSIIHIWFRGLKCVMHPVILLVLLLLLLLQWCESYKVLKFLIESYITPLCSSGGWFQIL